VGGHPGVGVGLVQAEVDSVGLVGEFVLEGQVVVFFAQVVRPAEVCLTEVYAVASLNPLSPLFLVPFH
jgi:hypothetical protein